jgi:hypothetical protein
MLSLAKGKFHPRTDHEGPEGEQMYSYTLPLTSALDVGGCSAPCLGRFTPQERPRHPLYSRLGETQSRSGRVRKTSPPSDFDPRTVQPVASRYIDCAFVSYNSSGIISLFVGCVTGKVHVWCMAMGIVRTFYPAEHKTQTEFRMHRVFIHDGTPVMSYCVFCVLFEL